MMPNLGTQISFQENVESVRKTKTTLCAAFPNTIYLSTPRPSHNLTKHASYSLFLYICSLSSLHAPSREDPIFLRLLQPCCLQMKTPAEILHQRQNRLPAAQFQYHRWRRWNSVLQRVEKSGILAGITGASRKLRNDSEVFRCRQGPDSLQDSKSASLLSANCSSFSEKQRRAVERGGGRLISAWQDRVVLTGLRWCQGEIRQKYILRYDDDLAAGKLSIFKDYLYAIGISCLRSFWRKIPMQLRIWKVE